MSLPTITDVRLSSAAEIPTHNINAPAPSTALLGFNELGAFYELDFFLAEYSVPRVQA